MNGLVAPLTPPDCDLQDFAFMPLQVARLRDSDMAATADPEACWYAVLLWAASWHQLPAASLPNDDAVLARLVGLGRDLRTFRKHKAAALHKFVLCSDGRLYHPVVAEQALEAWERKWQQRWRTECARIKKANQRNGTDVPYPTYEEFRSSASADPGPDFVPTSVPGDTGDCPRGNGIQGTETGTETGTSNSEDKSSAMDIALTGDLDKDAWAVAISVLETQGRLSEPQARRFFGAMLRDTGVSARDLYPAITSAMVNATQDPQAYLRKAATGIASRRVGAEARRVGFV